MDKIEEALRFRGHHTSDGYIDCDGLDHGVIYGSGCVSGCLFQTGYSLDLNRYGCYLFAEKGLSKQEIFSRQVEMTRSGVRCEWWCNNDSDTIEERDVRGEIIRIAKKNGFFEEYHVHIPSKKTSEGCFIATAVYGDYDHPKVMVLREFRDRYLFTTRLGSFFVLMYYRLSPFFVRYLAGRPVLLASVRNIINLIVALLDKNRIR